MNTLEGDFIDSIYVYRLWLIRGVWKGRAYYSEFMDDGIKHTKDEKKNVTKGHTL